MYMVKATLNVVAVHCYFKQLSIKLMEESYANPWKTVSTKEIYDNPWISLTHRDVINPSGNPGIYGVVHFKNLAIGVVPLDENYNTWLVGQFRYTINEYTWEIPEGGCPLNTPPLLSAKRELLEETGISANQWTDLGDVQVSNSVTDELGKMYLAQGLSFGEAQPEETEQLIVKKVPLSEAIAMVFNQKIKDCLSVIALLKVHLLIQEGKL